MITQSKVIVKNANIFYKLLTKHKQYASMKSIMTQKTKTTTKKTATKTKAELEKALAKDERKLAKDKVMLAEAEERIVEMTIGEDVRNAVLIVSLLINMVILITWVLLQVTTEYDYVVSALVFGR